MKTKIALVARYLLGALFLVFGLNGFFHFLPMTPPPLPENAMSYIKGLMATGYFMPLLSGTQVLTGVLLVSGFAAPVGLILLAPVTVHIVLFHAFFTPALKDMILPIIILALHLLAASGYWKLYRPLFMRP